MIDPLSTNTHSYDGKWEELVQKIKSHPIYFHIKDKSSTTLLGIYARPLKNLKIEIHRRHPSAKQYMDMILSGSGNMDPSNNVDALEMLVFLSLLPPDNDMYDVLTEQLLDMSTGPCPQGRTTRLCQVIFSFL
jgi:hypothetical protein